MNSGVGREEKEVWKEKESGFGESASVKLMKGMEDIVCI